MKKIIFTLSCVLSVFTTFSQTEISGTVKDQTGFPILGANVTLVGTATGAVTDFDGNFSFTADLSGSQTIQASYVGYSSSEKTIELNGSPISIDFVLQESAEALDEILLTATATFRSKKESPLSISSFKAQELTRLNANSQADIVASIPGIVADGGGGEGATNIFVRGLPSGGQNDFSPIQYDGLTLAGYGLSSTAGDVYARVDQGVKGVEFVRGGSAILFGAGSTAGIINYISKTGDTSDENIINLEIADEGRVKAEFYSGGKLGGEDSNTFYAISGWVRKDSGPLDFGLPSKGYQFRANLKKKFENGSFTIYSQFIDDKAQFLLGLPLDGNSRERINGNDGRTVYQLNSSHLRNTSFLTPDGEYKSPIGNGIHTRGFYVMGKFDYNLKNDWKVKAKVKFSDYVSDFALYVAANGNANTPVTLNEYIQTITQDHDGDPTTPQTLVYPNATNLTASYVGGGALGANDRIIDNLHVDRNRPITDYVGELNLTKKIQGDKVEHNITFGTYLAYTEGEDNNYQFRTLTAFNNEPQLVDFSFTDENSNNVIYSQNGLTNRIGINGRTYLTQERIAFYATDEMVLDRWRFDIGFRIENQRGSREIGSISSQQVYTDPDLTSDLQNVNYATGASRRAEVTETDWAASIAALYKLNDNLNLYANASKGYFFPLLRSVNVISNNVTRSPYNSEKIYQVETGIKYGNGKFSGTLAGYYTTLVDRVAIQRLNFGGSIGTVDGIETLQDTRTFGVEASWDWKFVEDFSFNGNITIQEHELTADAGVALQSGVVDGVTLVEGNAIEGFNIGNQLRRQPKFLSTLRLDYDNSKFDAFASANIRGSQFNDDASNVELDGFTVLRVGAGYTIPLEDEANLRFGISVYNLGDSQGLSEGNPRAFAQGTGGEFFSGRPILPRRVFFNATFNF